MVRGQSRLGRLRNGLCRLRSRAPRMAWANCDSSRLRSSSTTRRTRSRAAAFAFSGTRFFSDSTMLARSMEGSILARISGSNSSSFMPRRSMASCCNRTTTSLGKKVRIWSSHRATRGIEPSLDGSVREPFGRRLPFVAADLLIDVACSRSPRAPRPSPACSAEQPRNRLRHPSRPACSWQSLPRTSRQRTSCS